MAVTNIDIPGATNTHVAGADAAGDAFGWYQDSAGQHGFVDRNGTIMPIDIAGSTSTSVYGVDASGNVFGTSNVRGFASFVDSNGNITSFNFPDGTAVEIEGVTASGVVFGVYTSGSPVSGFVEQGFIDINGTFTSISVPGAAQENMFGVDAAGDAFGSYEDSSSVWHGFVDSNGTITPIDVPGASSTLVHGVDAGGDAAGWYQDSAGGHGFIDSKGTITTINIGGVTGLNVNGIDAAGDVFGNYSDSSGVWHGFVDSDGIIRQVSIGGYTIVNGVDAAGDVFGDYIDSAGNEHGFAYAVPTLAAGGIATFTGGGSPVVLDSGLTVTDSGSTLVGATISIGVLIGGDTLNFTNQNGITGSYNSTTGVLTLSGTASAANYQTALDSITYSFYPSNGDPTASGGHKNRTIDWVVGDGVSNPVQATSTLNTVHAVPTVTAGATATFDGGGSPVAVDSGLGITAPDSGGQLTSAKVKISAGFTAGDMLNFTNQNGITGSFDSATGILTLSGMASVAAYQAALRSISYGFSPANGDPTHGGGDTSRTLDWVVGDGVSFSSDAFSTLSVAHFAPSGSPGGSVTYRSGDPPITLGGGFTVSDPDSGGILTGATVQITGGTFASDGDVLAATTTGTNIHASYDAATETLTLSGTDTLSHYQSVLDGVTFASGLDPMNGGADPSRTVTWTLSDGSSTNGVSTPVTSQILLGDFNNTALAQAPDGTLDFLEFQGTTLLASESGFASWNIMAEGDFNHDGQGELVSQNPTTGQIDLLFVNNSGQLYQSELLQGDYWKVVGAGDFDGSGRTGIATQNADTGQVDLLWFTGTQLTGSELLAQPLPTIVGAADFNGDGQTDLVGQLPGGQLDFLFFNSTQLAGSALTPESYWPVHDVSNYGAADNSQMVSQDPVSGQLDYLKFSGTSIVSTDLVQPPLSPLSSVPGSSLAANLFQVG
jgi:hypothetical protein